MKKKRPQDPTILEACARIALNNPHCGIIEVKPEALAKLLGVGVSQARNISAGGTDRHSHIQKLEQLAREQKHEVQD